ncbi:hypothetical protein C8R43DRAFT_869847 [Mycena crocata]|nr:hypothetical protein C8R43DRAFT_869847 [Mycena crocata]
MSSSPQSIRAESTTIDSLPNEVLVAILKEAADQDLPRNSWERAPFPLTASLVDSHWRAVACASPDLWTTIRISNQPQSQKWAILCLQRSASRPLDISINLQLHHDRRWPKPVIPFDETLTIVAPHVSRWRTIVMRGYDRHLGALSNFIQHPPFPISTLTYLHLFSLDPQYAS